MTSFLSSVLMADSSSMISLVSVLFLIVLSCCPSWFFVDCNILLLRFALHVYSNANKRSRQVLKRLDMCKKSARIRAERSQYETEIPWKWSGNRLQAGPGLGGGGCGRLAHPG
jgi:hypothetical protein